MAYLFEPYNAYQKPPKKKHWVEEAEEEALYYYMLEQQMLEDQFLNQQKNYRLLVEKSAIDQNQQQNTALISQHAQPSSQQVQNAAPETVCGNAGAGGTPPYSYFQDLILEPSEVASFTLSPSSGVGPLTVAFINTSRTPENDTFFWNFGSGSLTSALSSPPSLTYTQTGSYTVILQETSSAGNMTSASATLTVNAPTLTASFTLSTSSNAAPSTGTFTNTTTYNGSGTLTYLWQYGSGSLTSTSATPNPLIYTRSGPYTASLQVTESSYKLTSVTTFRWRIS